MWNSKKMYEIAKAIVSTLEGTTKEEFQQGINFYRMDSGETLMAVFSEYFKESFMRQFWIGDSSKFRKEFFNKKTLHHNSIVTWK